MKKMICLSAMAVLFALFTYSGGFDHDSGIFSLSSGVSTAQAAEQWQEELNEICSNTHNAMSMSQDELKAMISKCDDLKPKLDKLNNPAKKKHALKKLNKCRDLYFFMIESNVIKE